MGSRPRLIAFALLVSLAIPFAAVPVFAKSEPTDHAMQAMQKGDYKTALAELRPLAEKNDAKAQFLMGMLYDAGHGVDQDPSIAAKWYRKAADQGHLLAQLYLGMLYHYGQGVPQDFEEAARLFQAPADSGDAMAEFYLGWMNAVGHGV